MPTRTSRLWQSLVVLWVAVSLNFVLPRAMPGSPLALLAGTDAGLLTAGERAALVAEAGLDRPLIVQYGRYLRQLARGDLGYSYQRREPVGQVLAERLPWSLLLAGSSQALCLVLGLAAAAWTAGRRGRRLDHGLL